MARGNGSDACTQQAGTRSAAATIEAAALGRAEHVEAPRPDRYITPPTDSAPGYDRYHRMAETHDFVSAEPTFEQVLDQLVQTRGDAGYAWIWTSLARAAIELAAPEAVQYPYVIDRMVGFCTDYRAYLRGEVAVKPQPGYKPVSDGDADRLRELTETLQAGFTAWSQGAAPVAV